MNKTEAKEQAVKEYLSGSGSTRSLGLKYGYSNSSILRWSMAEKRQSEKQEKLIKAKQSGQQKEAMPDNVEALQEEVRVMRIRLQLMEAMIDIADEQLGTEIRKKVGARQS
jgi:transposase-like protein